jgi:hypothetical protein
MQMRNRFRVTATVAVAVLGAASLARADVKIVSEVTIKGVPKAAQAQISDKTTTTTTYYKASKQRTETDKSVTITDLDGDKFYTLDPVKKTYYVMSSKDLEKLAADNPMLAMIKMDTTTTVTPSSETKSIAGKTAKKYAYTTVMKMGMEGADESISAMLPTITISGEQWTTEEITLPVDYRKVTQSNFMRSMPPMMAKGIKDMVDKMAEIKGLPLSSVITVTVQPSASAPPQAASAFPKDPIVTTTEVKSIVEGPLDDALFTVPADYKEVKAPASNIPGGLPGAGAPTPGAAAP